MPAAERSITRHSQLTGRASGADAKDLRGSVDSNEDDVSLLHGRVHVGGEEQVLAADRLDHLVEAGLVDGQLIGVPFGDLRSSRGSRDSACEEMSEK